MADLQDVEISRGLLIAQRSNGRAVALPVQPAMLAAAGLTRVKNHEGFRFEIDQNGGVSAVRVDESGHDVMHKFFRNRPARIHLGGRAYTGRTRGGHKLQVAIPGRGADLFQALALLRRSHPRGAPPAGIVVTARFADDSAQKAVRRDSSRLPKRDDPWSPSWTDGLGQVVGAVTISRLFHGEPHGRTSIAAELGIELPTGKDSRREIVENVLGLVWVSRIAVDAPYRRESIGTELLRILRTSIAATLPWQAKRIEVLQSVPATNANRPGKFFIDAGYRWNGQPTYTAPARMINDDGVPAADLTPLRTLYYWTDIA